MTYPRACQGHGRGHAGNVAVISLDANDVSYEIPANLGHSGGAQTRWLDAQLGRFRRDPRIDFVVVLFHHCAYSTTNQHASEGGVRAEWVRLFDTHSVDLVVNGHNSFLAVDVTPGGWGKAAALTLRAVAENGTEIDHLTVCRSHR